MAIQMDGAMTDLSPELIGRAFVNQFYQILHHQPELVNGFYTNSSTMSRPGADGELVLATALKEIKELFDSLDCAESKAEILTADAQASHMEGVIVMVTGYLTGKDNVRRKFTETFFLAPQANGYFVLNNAFRFVDEATEGVVNSVEEQVDRSASPAPVSSVAPVQETIEVANNYLENRTVVAEEKVEEAEVSVDEPKSSVAEKTVTQPSVSSSDNVQPIVETSSNGHVDVPKKSYASLFTTAKGGAAHVPASAAKPAKADGVPQSMASSIVVQQAPAATAPAATAQTAPSRPSAPNGSNGRAISSNKVEGKGHSIYIGGLPHDATPQLVEREFKQFGTIKRNGIQVRSNKGFCFGFVEYEDAKSKEKAIEKGYLTIAGEEAFIEEKKTNAVANGGRGGYRNYGYRNDGFRNDGGYRSDGPRDDGFRQGNYSNGRGNFRNDYSNGKRNGEVPSRGSSRSADGFVHQNGGGKGTRQGVTAK